MERERVIVLNMACWTGVRGMEVSGCWSAAADGMVSEGDLVGGDVSGVCAGEECWEAR